MDANWIGIGGSTITQLIQVGTTSVTSGGSTTYFAWYELLPAGPINIDEPVSAGDQMIAKIDETTSSGRWYIGIEDATKGWTATATITYTAGTANSAEWITERPYDTATQEFETLADFGAVRFHDLRVSGADLAAASLTATEMVDTSGQVIAYPGKMTTTTKGSFTNYYGMPTAPSGRTPPKPRPTVSGVAPSSGPANGGTAVVISGSNFTGAAAVDFGSTATAGFRVTAATRITTTSPAGTGTVYVTVTTPGGTSALTTGGQFSYVTPLPAVRSVSPGIGPTAGGTQVTITGANLTGAAAVDFGATAAASFRMASATRITATSPSHAAGSVRVTVTTSAGTSPVSPAGLFSYLAPKVTAIAPRRGPTAGGTQVTITGADFVRGARVRFGTKVAAHVTVVSATRITARSPVGAGTVDVTVTIPGGTSAVTNADRFSYLAPKVTSVLPSRGPTAGGTLVTITGADFVRGARVRFGTKVAAHVTVVSATRITARSPVGAGTVDVTVTIPGGTSAVTSADRFSYLAPTA